MYAFIRSSNIFCVPSGVPCESWPGLMRTMSASYADDFSLKAAVFAAASPMDESYSSSSHAPPALITELAIGIESTRLPSGPLSEPPFLAPGTTNCTTASLYLAPAGDSRSVLYRVGPFDGGGAAGSAGGG